MSNSLAEQPLFSSIMPNFTSILAVDNMLGIVILNYNNAVQTLQCLESLHKHCPNGNYKVCVVDNASRPEDIGLLRRECSEELLIADENRGYASGNNIGLEHFDKNPDVDAVLILNNDTLFTEDILTPLYSYLMTHGDCGVVFPLVVDRNGGVDSACLRHSKSCRDLILQATRLKLKRREFIPESDVKDAAGRWLTDADGAIFTEVPPGSCMMLRKDVFKSVGWLDPNTFLYFEEHILSDKLKAVGLKAVLLPDCSIIHLGAQTTSRQPSKAIFGHWRHSYLYYLASFSKVPFWLIQLLRFRTWLGGLSKK